MYWQAFFCIWSYEGVFDLQQNKSTIFFIMFAAVHNFGLLATTMKAQNWCFSPSEAGWVANMSQKLAKWIFASLEDFSKTDFGHLTGYY